MNNIYQEIGLMRKGMKAIGYSNEDIEKATNDVTSAPDYDEALLRIKKYWR